MPGLRPFRTIPRSLDEWDRWCAAQDIPSASSDPNVTNITQNVSYNDSELRSPCLRDYSVHNSVVTSQSGSIAFDYETGNTFQVTLTENITAITFNNVPTDCYGEFLIKFTQDGTGSRTVGGWPSGVKWPGGTAPTITTTATTGVDIVALKTFDGTTFYGDYSQDYS